MNIDITHFSLYYFTFVNQTFKSIYLNEYIKSSMTIHGNNTSSCYIYLNRSDIDVVKSNIEGFYLDRGDIDGVKLSGVKLRFLR